MYMTFGPRRAMHIPPLAHGKLEGVINMHVRLRQTSRNDFSENWSKHPGISHSSLEFRGQLYFKHLL